VLQEGERTACRGATTRQRLEVTVTGRKSLLLPPLFLREEVEPLPLSKGRVRKRENSCIVSKEARKAVALLR